MSFRSWPRRAEDDGVTVAAIEEWNSARASLSAHHLPRQVVGVLLQVTPRTASASPS